MIYEIDFHSGAPIYKQIVEQIKRYIASGALKPGEQLETVRSLAGQIKVNPMTVSKAYSILEMEGFLLRKRGVGLFVKKQDAKDIEMEKIKLFDESIVSAAKTAVEMGISEDDAVRVFKEKYEEIKKEG